MNLIKTEEDRDFLIAQKHKERNGCMLGIYKKLTAAELHKPERVIKELRRKSRQHSSISNIG